MNQGGSEKLEARCDIVRERLTSEGSGMCSYCRTKVNEENSPDGSGEFSQ